MVKNELKIPYERDVLPRHVRSFVSVDGWSGRAVHESEQVLPLLADDGTQLAEKRVVVEIPSGEAMKPYKFEQFKIGNLLAAGVPLNEVNFMLNSRSQNEQLIQKAIDLGIYDEDLSVFRSVENNFSVEPLKTENNEQ